MGAILVNALDKKLSADSPLQAEMMFIKLGMGVAYKRGFNKLILETYFMVAIDQPGRGCDVGKRNFSI